MRPTDFTLEMSQSLPTDAERTQMEQVVARFEDAWLAGQRPEIADYLPTTPGPRQQVLVELIHTDLEYRLKNGEAAAVEDYLRRFSELAGRPEVVLDLAVEEYRLRQRSAAVPVREYFDRFPELRQQLRERLATGEQETLLAGPPATVPTLTGMFGRYRIERLLGRGSMGAVYQAFDTHLERTVALKVPRSQVVPGSPEARRFEDEARAAAALHHPHICPVYDAGVIGGVPYLIMACIEGRPLSEALPGPVPAPRAAELVRTIALALGAAHARGVIHRDLKPGNILIDAQGQPVVTDFGLAHRPHPDDAGATVPGQVIGTPAYMAPEQARGDTTATGVAADVYALGVILYELLTGQRPFQGTAPVVLERVRHSEPPPPSHWLPGLDPKLEAVCLRAMARSAQERFPSMAALAEALVEWSRPAAGGPPPAPPPGPSLPVPVAAQAAETVATTLRQWGWELGVEKLAATAREVADAQERAAWQVLLGWLAGERGRYAESAALFQGVEAWPALAGWALLGRALQALRERDYPAARTLLAQAAEGAGAQDGLFKAALAHGRGALAHQTGADREALAELHSALEQFGPSHFGAGRVLDTLGTVHAHRSDFAVAERFYTHALEVKRRFADDAGVALGHGQLGRLYLGRGWADRADEHFRLGIGLARRLGDERGEAQLTNHRGQVRLAQGKPAEAEPFLEESTRSAGGRWPVVEGFARKDLALAHLALGQETQAEQEVSQAESLFRSLNFAEGVAHVRRVLGLLRRRQGRTEEALRCLRTSATLFEQQGEFAESARSLAELAGTQQAGGVSPAVVAETLRTALEQAERARHLPLITRLKGELRQLSELEFLRHVCRNVRGQGDSEGIMEEATVLLSGLRADRTEGEDVAAELAFRQHHCCEIAGVLEDHGVTVVQYRGDEVLALARGPDHARRAVAAALGVAAALAEFNRPGRVLGWPLWHLHAGVASGRVWRGDLGTPRQADHTLLGPVVRLAASLAAESQPDVPRVSEATRALAAPWFHFAASGPETASGTGSTALRHWSVRGPAR
jgi:tetratricopeptide (TPR) repeat protein